MPCRHDEESFEDAEITTQQAATQMPISSDEPTAARSPRPAAGTTDWLGRSGIGIHGAKVILLIGGYDKGGDPSERRQQREIREARRLLTQFQERQRRERARTRKRRG